MFVRGADLYANTVLAVFCLLLAWLGRSVIRCMIEGRNESMRQEKGKVQNTLLARSKPPTITDNMAAGAERAPRDVISQRQCKDPIARLIVR